MEVLLANPILLIGFCAAAPVAIAAFIAIAADAGKAIVDLKGAVNEHSKTNLL